MISPTEAAREIYADATRVRSELPRIVRVTVIHAAQLARGKIGTRQPDWDSLAPRTIRDKTKLGFGGPDYSPLERTGAMRESILTEFAGLTGRVYSTDPKMVYSELGTSREPPRPVLIPSLDEAAIGASGLLIELAETIR